MKPHKNKMRRVLTYAICLLLPAAAVKAGDKIEAPGRVSFTEKGSLLVFPKVELRWDEFGNLAADTMIEISNDYPSEVGIRTYFVHGDPEMDEPGSRNHPGWLWVDNEMQLTSKEPAFWSLYSGEPKGASPFPMLDPGSPPGRPANDGSGDRVLRGFLLIWATDSITGEEIRWNHLSGQATLIDYANGTAWQYKAYTFQAFSAIHGEPTGTPGKLNLDGVEYDKCFDDLFLSFFASDTTALSGGSRIVTSDTELTLMSLDIDLRQETDGPVLTKTKFDVWNMNEFKLSGSERCLTGWDGFLLSQFDTPNHFLLENLQTNMGKARIAGMASAEVCGEESVSTALLGVSMKRLTFDLGSDFAAAGTNLVGMGEETAMIQADLPMGIPPEKAATSAPQYRQSSNQSNTISRQLIDVSDIPSE